MKQESVKSRMLNKNCPCPKTEGERHCDCTDCREHHETEVKPPACERNASKIYPRKRDRQTVYLDAVVNGPNISVGAYTMYNDFVNDPVGFERNNVLYHYPINNDRLEIGKFCSIACGAKFIFTSANHTISSLSTYPFPLFFEEWNLPVSEITTAWDNKGDIIVGNDVWIGYEAVIMSGVRIGDGAVIGTRAVVTKDVEPYTIVGGIPAKPIRKRFGEETIRILETLRWWDLPHEKIRQLLPLIRRGNAQDFADACEQFASESSVQDQRPL